MAAVYESVATTVWTDLNGGGDLTIPKPTGLAAGNYLVAHLVAIVGGSDNASGWTTPSGWTSLDSSGESANSNSSVSQTIFYKVADTGDAAATDFSFAKIAGDDAYSNGALYRISGASAISVVADTDSDDTTPIFTNAITPAFANSLFLFLVGSSYAGTGAQSVSGYAITTDNPSWTEVYDMGRTEADGTDRGVMSGAYASRPQTTSTGDWTCTLSQTQNTIGALVCITPIVDATVSTTVLDLTITVETPAVTGSAIVSPTVLTVTVTMNTPTVTIAPVDVVNISKSNMPNWINPDKS